MTFKLNEPWNNDLSDKTSSAYTTLKTRIVTPFDTYFQGNTHYRVAIPQNITETVNDGSSIIAVDLVVYIKTGNLVNIQSEVTPMMNGLSQNMTAGFGDLVILPYSQTIASMIDGVWGYWHGNSLRLLISQKAAC